MFYKDLKFPKQRVALAIGLVLCGAAFVVTPVAVQAQTPQAATPVVISTVQAQTFEDEVEALGTLKANESVDLTSTVTELVTAVHFEDGQRVQKDDVLLEMDAGEERAELAEQQAVLEETQRQVKRLEPLVKKGAASESDLDGYRSEVSAIQARIDAIQVRIDRRVVKAPYNGIVGLRNISVGALAQPGTLITTIDDDGVMKLDFSVPEVFLSTLKPGVEIEATSEAYPNETFTGEIASVDSRIDPVTRSIEARALLDNQEGMLKPGLLMHVLLKKNPRQALVIPEEAIVPEGSKSFALVVRDESGSMVVHKQEVKLGTRQFGLAEVLGGLAQGDMVVTHGTLKVRQGSVVTIAGEEKDNQRIESILEEGAQQ